MHRWTIALSTALCLVAVAPAAQANPLMPVQRLAAAAANDDAVTQVHFRPWRHRHYRHYGWYRGRHFGWYGPQRQYGWYGPRRHWRYY